MATDKRKEYDVTINGVVHTLLLDSDDAERYGEAAVLVVATKKAAVANKAATPENK